MLAPMYLTVLAGGALLVDLGEAVSRKLAIYASRPPILLWQTLAAAAEAAQPWEVFNVFVRATATAAVRDGDGIPERGEGARAEAWQSLAKHVVNVSCPFALVWIFSQAWLLLGLVADSLPPKALNLFSFCRRTSLFCRLLRVP